MNAIFNRTGNLVKDNPGLTRASVPRVRRAGATGGIGPARFHRLKPLRHGRNGGCLHADAFTKGNAPLSTGNRSDDTILVRLVHPRQ